MRSSRGHDERAQEPVRPDDSRVVCDRADTLARWQRLVDGEPSGFAGVLTHLLAQSAFLNVTRPTWVGEKLVGRVANTNQPSERGAV